MKFWIQTLQLMGIALFAGAVIANPPSLLAVLGGVWLILFAYLLHRITGVSI